MKLFGSLKHGLAILLICTPLFAAGQAAPENDTGSQRKSLHGSALKSAYAVDGRTSASVLAAKRSHNVSEQDEYGLAIFSGLMVIGVIVFFTQFLSRNR